MCFRRQIDHADVPGCSGKDRISQLNCPLDQNQSRKEVKSSLGFALDSLKLKTQQRITPFKS